MKYTFGIAIFAAAMATAGLGAATVAEINERIGELGAKQIELGDATRDAAKALDNEFASGRHDTPEMKELRGRIEEISRELAAAKAELRAKFDALPQFRERAAAVATNTAALKAMAAERAELLKQRAELLSRRSN